MSNKNGSYKIKSLDERDHLCTKAVNLRESGNLKKSLILFERIKNFDQKHNRHEPLIDILGHIRIVYTRLAESSSCKSKKLHYLYNALQALNDATNVCTSHPSISIETQSVLHAHISSVILKLSLLEDYDNYKKNKLLNSALEHIEKSIKNIPGSIAHKAWPANTKAQILLELGNIEEALTTVKSAETWLKTGKNAELSSNDATSHIKLDVWTTGLYLTKAKIYMAELKPILAKYYIDLVLDYPTIENHLEERKKDAQILLDKLKEKFWYLDILETNLKPTNLTIKSSVYERNLTLESYIKNQLASAPNQTPLSLESIKFWDTYNNNPIGKIETSLAELYVNSHKKISSNNHKNNTKDNFEIDEISNRYLKIAYIQKEINYSQVSDINQLRKYLTVLNTLTDTNDELRVYSTQLQAHILYMLHRTRESLETLSYSANLLNNLKNETDYYKILKINESKSYIKIYSSEKEGKLLKKHLHNIDNLLK